METTQPRIPAQVVGLVARNRRLQAMRVLDRIIGSDYGLFREDPQTLGRRQAALQFKIYLLIEWGRYGEALAWLCLETELNPANVHAHAVKAHLKRALHIDDFETARQRGSPAASRSVQHPGITWDGVAGMRELKLILETDIIMPFLEPDVYRQYKVPLPNGVLFYGPPGCGKTFIARKLAAMLQHTFIEFKPSDLASIYVHGTQEKIGAVFTQAQANAPALLFFDEIDAFVPRRGEGLYQHYSAEVNEFLAQLNDCAKRSILVIGATNYVNRVDEAVRRPGRFDKKIYVGPPDIEARIEAMRLYLRGRPQADIDLYTLLVDKDLYSFADLELIANDAARDALQSRAVIGRSHLDAAFGRIPASVTQEMIVAMSKE
jgi:SpoVK/Ycf46/Vps4 family AAA+-type ATPase